MYTDEEIRIIDGVEEPSKYQMNSPAKFIDAMFKGLYKGSAWTWEGLMIPEGEDGEQKLIDQINKVFKDNNLPEVSKECFFWYTGHDMNEYFNLHGDNRYKENLTFVSFVLNDFAFLNEEELSKFCLLKIELGARWFDDIIDNNSRREQMMGYKGYEQ